MEMAKERARRLIEMPNYGITEAASYLQIPAATLRSWTRGQNYNVNNRTRRFHPIIKLPIPQVPQLSFVNLVEAHVVNALKRADLSFIKIRRGVEYLNRNLPSEHPLLDNVLFTDKRGMFIHRMGAYIEISRDGQTALEEMLRSHLLRIELDQFGLPVRLYPFTRRHRDFAHDEVRKISISPSVAFGRPVIAGTGIPVEDIASRHGAGESIKDLADDYGRSPEEIEEALRFRQAA